MLVSGTVHAGMDSRYAWRRLFVALALETIGSVGMWSVPVALPAVQAEFGPARGAASLAFTVAVVGLAVRGVGLGRLFDRFGMLAPGLLGTVAISLGYLGA